MTTTLAKDRALLYLRHPVTAYQQDKAKDQHFKYNRLCYFCKAKKSKSGFRPDIHHINPYHAFPHLACDPQNLVTACRECHWRECHCGMNWKVWDANLFETYKEVRAVRLYYQMPMTIDDLPN